MGVEGPLNAEICTVWPTLVSPRQRCRLKVRINQTFTFGTAKHSPLITRQMSIWNLCYTRRPQYGGADHFDVFASTLMHILQPWRMRSNCDAGNAEHTNCVLGSLFSLQAITALQVTLRFTRPPQRHLLGTQVLGEKIPLLRRCHRTRQAEHVDQAQLAGRIHLVNSCRWDGK